MTYRIAKFPSGIYNYRPMNRIEALQQTSDARNWGMSCGLPLETMFVQEAARPYFWWVYYALPGDPNSIGVEYFGDEEEIARKWNDETEKSGYDVFLIGSPGAGFDECPLSSALVDSSEQYRTHYMFHEGSHVWARKHLSGDREFPNDIDEGLAEVVGLELMVNWYKDNKPNQVLLASDYVGYRVSVLTSTQHLVETINCGDSAQLDLAIEEFLDANKKWKQNFKVSSNPGKRLTRREDFNFASLAYYSSYSSKFSEIRSYFQRNRINIIDFLSNPFPHKDNLLKLAQTQ